MSWDSRLQNSLGKCMLDIRELIMTKEEWDTCKSLESMLAEADILGLYRKELMKFGCDCCRRIWHLIDDPRLKKAIELRERYILGDVAESDMNEASNEARNLRNQIRFSSMAEKQGFNEQSPEAARAWAAAAAAMASSENFQAASKFSARAKACVDVGDWGENYYQERVNQCELLRSIIEYPAGIGRG